MKIPRTMPGFLLVTMLAAKIPATLPQHSRQRDAARDLPVSVSAAPAPTAPTPPAADVLRRAANNFIKTHALQFALAADKIPAGLHLSGVVQGSGTAIWPDQLAFDGSIKQSPALSMGFSMVMCGPDQYIEMGDGNFQKLSGAPNVGQLFFSHDTSFIAGVLTQLKQPSAPQAVTLDHLPMWHLQGSVPRTVLMPVTGAATSALGAIQAEVWVGQQDMRLHQLTLSGKMFQGDSTQTTRTLTFSHFDDSLALTVPRGTLPCGGRK